MGDNDPIIGNRFKLLVGDGASPVEAFTELGMLVSLKPMQFSRNEVDGTHHGIGMEKIDLGILRSGPVTGTINLDLSNPTQSRSVGMLGDIFNNTSRNYRIPINPVTGYPWLEFAAKVQLFDMQEVPVDAVMQAQFGLRADLETLDIHEDET